MATSQRGRDHDEVRRGGPRPGRPGPLPLGLSESGIRAGAAARREPGWMVSRRLDALACLARDPLPAWAVEPAVQQPGARSAPGGPGPARVGPGWPPGDAGEREARAELAAHGVVVCDLALAVHEHGELVERYFGSVVPAVESAVAALNTAAWSAGTFVYVPPGVTVRDPIQVDFRITTGAPARVERTVIVAGEGARVQCVRGCSAPAHTAAALHASVVEIACEAGSDVAFSTIQNWSGNVLNLVVESARCATDARMVWIGADIGSGRTWRHPSLHLQGPGASGELRSVAFAGTGQHHDTALEVVHAAPGTASAIVATSVSFDGGSTAAHGAVRVEPGAPGATGSARCDALLLDERSRGEASSSADLREGDARVARGGTVSRVGDGQRFYLASRGLSDAQAAAVLVNAFVDPVTSALPVEYAVEWSRLIELQLEGAVG